MLVVVWDEVYFFCRQVFWHQISLYRMVMLGCFCCRVFCYQDLLCRIDVLDSTRYCHGAIFCYQDLLSRMGMLDFFMYWQGAIVCCQDLLSWMVTLNCWCQETIFCYQRMVFCCQIMLLAS